MQKMQVMHEDANSTQIFSVPCDLEMITEL